MPVGLILGFDTSGPACAAALLRGDVCIAQRHEDMTRGQAERLMPMLAEMLADVGAGFGDLAAIGVGTGPGNFTGVRIAVAAARGLALARAIPAIGIGRLEAAAFGLPRPLLAVEPAQRGGVYLQRFAPDASGPPEQPEQIDAEALPGLALPPGHALTGSAAALLVAAMSSAPKTPPPVLPAAMPLAEAIARLAASRRAQPQPRPAPIYLRPADAAPSSQSPPPLLAQP